MNSPSKPHGTAMTLSERMARIGKVNTRPELAVRKLAHALGYRFRLHRRDLPGTPDLVFPRLGKAILVHGCFWHRHTCKDGRKLPTGNHAYWLPKFTRNVARDVENLAGLRMLGWRVLTVWECEVKDAGRLNERIRRFLER